MTFLNTELKKKWGSNQNQTPIFLVICGFRLFKETDFEFPKGLFSPCSFGHPVANLGLASFWKIQGILKKKIFGGLWLNGTMQTELLYKMMLVTPSQERIHSTACSLVETDIWNYPYSQTEGLKNKMHWFADQISGVYNNTFFPPLWIKLCPCPLWPCKLSDFPLVFQGYNHLLRLELESGSVKTFCCIRTLTRVEAKTGG